VERFNGSMRDELLNGEELDSMLEARVVIQAWVEQYNTTRSHCGLGMLTPAAFAASWKERPGERDSPRCDWTSRPGAQADLATGETACR
jgi:transposase InsO family protein